MKEKDKINKHIVKMRLTSSSNAESRLKHNTHNRGVVITQESINNVKCKMIYFEHSINKKIQQWHREILKESMNRTDRFKYGEIGIIALINNIKTDDQKLIELSKGHKIYGDYKHVCVGNDNLYRWALSNLPDNSLVFMHNHPSESSFSYEDLNVFLRADSIEIMTVVNNSGKSHILVKEENFNRDKALNFLNMLLVNFRSKSSSNNEATYKAVKYFLNYSDKVLIDYIHD